MTATFFLQFYLFLSTFMVKGDENNTGGGFCEKTEHGVRCVNEENLRLTRLDGGQVGDIRDISVDSERVLHMKTVNLKPLVFEIEDFLTHEECDHFVTVAKNVGMQNSKTEKSLQDNRISLMDLNRDKQLDLVEMKLTLENGYDVYFEDDDVITMYRLLGMDTDNNNMITQDEMKKVSPAVVKQYLMRYLKDNPEKHSRYSKQAWLYPDQSMDEVFKRVQERVAKVIQLPLELVRLSDFQVVNYGVKGHYNAHLDSNPIVKDVPCCDRGKVPKCRICRYMTVLFYLNEVPSGGETAFPFANKEDINQTSAHIERVHHLYRNCDNASLRINAKKGKAIIWYNHLMNEETGWMGESDPYTLHGGCPVKEGEKWIANFWIRTNDNKSVDLERMKKLAYVTE